MKKSKILLFVLVVLISGMTFAAGDNMKTYRVLKMTEYLKLTPEQSKEFFPILEKYEGNVARINAKEEIYYEKIKDRSRNGEMSEKELNDVLQKVNGFDQDRVSARNEFMTRSRKVLKTGQMSRLPFFENEFRKNLKQEYYQRQKMMSRKPSLPKGNNPGQGGNGGNGQGGSGPQGPR